MTGVEETRWSVVSSMLTEYPELRGRALLLILGLREELRADARQGPVDGRRCGPDLGGPVQQLEGLPPRHPEAHPDGGDRNVVNWDNVEWIIGEYDAIEEPNIQDRVIALGLMAAELEAEGQRWMKPWRGT